MLPRRDRLVVRRNLRAAAWVTVIVLTAKARKPTRWWGWAWRRQHVTKPGRLQLLARVRPCSADTEGKPSTRACGNPASGGFERCLATRRGSHALDRDRVQDLKTLKEPRQGGHNRQPSARGARRVFTDRVIYTHVNNLRAKMEPDPSTPQIVVGVRGLGYRFDG
jgi:two-component system response regulator RegX3